jgi:hypothetical protein
MTSRDSMNMYMITESTPDKYSIGKSVPFITLRLIFSAVFSNAALVNLKSCNYR